MLTEKVPSIKEKLNWFASLFKMHVTVHIENY